MQSYYHPGAPSHPTVLLHECTQGTQNGSLGWRTTLKSHNEAVIFDAPRRTVRVGWQERKERKEKSRIPRVREGPEPAIMRVLGPDVIGLDEAAGVVSRIRYHSDSEDLGEGNEMM